MKKILVYFGIICLTIWSCSSSKNKSFETTTESIGAISDTIRIANDELEYEIIIIDNGFNSFLFSQARPRGYYTQSFFEGRNIMMVQEYNLRVQQPMRFDPNLYQMRIDYQSNINYGYEVNYLLYNYLVYFQIRNNERLTGFTPRP